MIRNIVGSVLALAGATAAVWSPFRAWYDGRPGRDYRIQDLFGGITDVRAQVIGSILLPFAFAALVTLVGLLLRSRAVVAVAGLIVLGFTVLWMVRVAQVQNGLSFDTSGHGLGEGVALAAGGGVLLLLGAALMSGRPRPRGTRADRADRADGADGSTSIPGGTGNPDGTAYGDGDRYGSRYGYGPGPDDTPPPPPPPPPPPHQGNDRPGPTEV
ncbi:hypothetical protein ABZ990_15865 [Streptomyces sp. NPDC046203]|uniref:hypothetical protein n=1 Tax=Streptomyces sp. NPDC046203 TaxID=3154602 RepID=UPI0033C93BF3